MPNGTVTTFYSYKGGVGRTFLLANAAWLLARWGRKVLCLDWDLEAPGLARYLAPAAPARPGVLDLVESVVQKEAQVEWRSLREPISGPWTGKGQLDLITAGREDEDYVDRLQKLEWPRLFEQGLSPKLEDLRAEWVSEYDHVLLDSRTGISDIGGICAAQLPDLLVMAFTATHQSLEGTLRVAQRVQRIRQGLPLDRGGLWCLPIPSRIPVGGESLLEKEWFGRFEKMLEPLFRPWKDRSVEVREYLQQLRVREYARWSFGEQLPIREERLDDPALVSWAVANVAALLDHRLDRSGEVSRNRHAYLEEAAEMPNFAAPPGAASKQIDVFISYSHHDKQAAQELYQALSAEAVSVFLDRHLRPGENWSEALYRARESARMIVVLLSQHYDPESQQATELDHVIRLANERAALIVPVFLDDASVIAAPSELQQRFGIFRKDERSWRDVARRLTRALGGPAAHLAGYPAPRPDDPSVWFKASELLKHRHSLGGAEESQYEVVEGPRAYMRIIPAGWQGKPPDRQAVERVPSPEGLSLLGRWSYADGGANKLGVLKVGIDDPEVDQGPHRTRTATQWFLRTGEVWGFDQQVTDTDRDGKQVLSYVYLIQQWSEFLRRAISLLRHLGATPPLRVEAGVTGLQGILWAAKLRSQRVPALDEIVTHDRQSSEWSEEDQLAFMTQAFNKVCDAFGIGHSTEADVSKTLKS